MVEKYLGNLFIVAAPSGGGKTSLVKALVKSLSNIAVSVSHTTREKRPGEEEGRDYFFVNQDTFVAMTQEGDFVEYAEVFGNFYGTSQSQLLQRLRSGIDVVLDIDWQGAQQIKHLFPDAVGIFVVPPSMDTLKARLQSRKQDDEAVINQRMARARDELSHYSEFDYLIVNDNFEKAAMELQSIVTAYRQRIERQCEEQKKLLSFLLSSK